MPDSKNVQSMVSDPILIEKRRSQILNVAIKLFSEKGYYPTTILDIAKEAGVSSGLIYQYFRSKEDVLFLTLMLVLETYKKEIPVNLQVYSNPLDRLCESLRTYCGIVDRLRDATVLAYRSTKSLPPERRVHIMETESMTNQIFKDCLVDCCRGGWMQEVNPDILVYQYVVFCHAWALKHWALKKQFDLEQYVLAGIDLLIVPFLTPKGRKEWHRARAADPHPVDSDDLPVGRGAGINPYTGESCLDYA